jgi:hypothetical protein
LGARDGERVSKGQIRSRAMFPIGNLKRKVRYAARDIECEIG